MLCQLFLSKGDQVIVPQFSFLMYRIYASISGAKEKEIQNIQNEINDFKKNRDKFQKNSVEKLDKFSMKCKNIGFDWLQINTDDDYIKFLMQFFRSRAKRS